MNRKNNKENIKMLKIECRKCLNYFLVEKKNHKYKCKKCGYEEELQIFKHGIYLNKRK
ncbi:MAG: hypothetical protein ACRCW0_06785 [Clostridium sp.]